MKLVSRTIRYDSTTRDQFGADTQDVLALIQKQYSVVEVETPGGVASQWFVQVYRKGIEENPEGLFGDTLLEAATRLAKALKIKI